MQSNVIVVCSSEGGQSETWNSKSCKCDCEGGESPSEFPSIRTGSSMVRGLDCMPGILSEICFLESTTRINLETIFGKQQSSLLSQPQKIIVDGFTVRV